MISGKDPDRLQNITGYYFKALRFHALRNGRLSKLVFMIILAGSLADSLLSAIYKTTSLAGLLYSTCLYVLLNFTLAVYLYACIREPKGEYHSIWGYCGRVAPKIPVLAAAFIVYILSVFLGITLLLIVPGIIFLITFIFNTCFIIDRNLGIFEAFKQSRKLTYGYRWKIFCCLSLFDFTILTVMVFILEVLGCITGNLLIQSFVFCFLISIFLMMNQKLIALMYLDLKYGISPSR